MDLSFRRIMMGKYAVKQIVQVVGRPSSGGGTDVAMRGRVRSVREKTANVEETVEETANLRKCRTVNTAIVKEYGTRELGGRLEGRGNGR